ncbi:phenylalanine--tRNA ligase subunit alpha, partial [bacterium]|nr:phenylalanine--tRNA ligase subunit alpha [bacterium]
MSNSDVLRELETIRVSGLEALGRVSGEDALQSWRTAYLGRSAPVMQVFQRLGSFDAEQRKEIGQAANQVKVALESAYTERLSALKD